MENGNIEACVSEYATYPAAFPFPIAHKDYIH